MGVGGEHRRLVHSCTLYVHHANFVGWAPFCEGGVLVRGQWEDRAAVCRQQEEAEGLSADLPEALTATGVSFGLPLFHVRDAAQDQEQGLCHPPSG